MFFQFLNNIREYRFCWDNPFLIEDLKAAPNLGQELKEECLRDQVSHDLLR